MSFLPKKPPPFRHPSKGISVSALNDMAAMIRRQVRGGKGTLVADLGDRTAISAKAPNTYPGMSYYIKQFLILQELDDYLLCTPFYPPNNGTTLLPQTYSFAQSQNNIPLVYVAKPYWLQRSPWDKQRMPLGPFTGMPTLYPVTYVTIGQRTVGTTTQTITPAYLPGEVISARKAPTGYYSTNPDGSLQSIDWMDVNDAGRSWVQSQSGSLLSYTILVPPSNATGGIEVSYSSTTSQQTLTLLSNPQWPTSTPPTPILSLGAYPLVMPADGIYEFCFSIWYSFVPTSSGSGNYITFGTGLVVNGAVCGGGIYANGTPYGVLKNPGTGVSIIDINHALTTGPVYLKRNDLVSLAVLFPYAYSYSFTVTANGFPYFIYGNGGNCSFFSAKRIQ